MNLKIISQKIESGSLSLKKQRDIVNFLFVKLTGKNIKHSKTGRPILDKSVDVSISHKDNLVSVGIVNSPHKVGIDIENINTNFNAELFLNSVINKTEIPFLKTFCEDKNISLSSAVAIFWSIKESFFKCLDYDLKPGKINILNISKDNEVKIDFSNEIKCLMKERKLKLCFMKSIFDENNVFSHTIMKESLL